MSQVTAEDLLEVKTFSWFAARDQLGINVRHMRVVITEGAPTTEQVAAHIGTTAGPLYKAIMPAAASFYGVSVRKMSDPTDAPVYSGEGAGVGTVAGEPLPLAVSGIITLRSNTTGRANRGRMFIPFPGEGSNESDGTPTAAYVTGLGALGLLFCTAWVIADGLGNDMTLENIVWHRLPETFIAIASCVARDRWATMHTRGDYGRVNQLPF